MIWNILIAFGLLFANLAVGIFLCALADNEDQDLLNWLLEFGDPFRIVLFEIWPVVLLAFAIEEFKKGPPGPWGPV